MEMKKRGNSALYGVLVAGLIILIIVHLSFHLAANSSSKSKILGFAINESIKDKYKTYSLGSKVIIILEILFVIGILSFGIFRLMINKNTIETIEKIKLGDYKKGEIKTDLDLLYNLLKEKRKLKLSTISKTFEVNNETVMEWSKILESANLASLNYPKFGEPEISLDTDGKEK